LRLFNILNAVRLEMPLFNVTTADVTIEMNHHQPIHIVLVILLCLTKWPLALEQIFRIVKWLGCLRSGYRSR